MADRTRVESVEIPWTDCGSWGLSPDGRFLACLDSNGTLSFVDVASSATIFKKKNFNDFVVIRDQFGNDHCTGDLRSAEIDFSPDGRFVLVLPVDASGSAFAWDLRQRKAVGLTVRLKIRLADRAAICLYCAGPAPDIADHLCQPDRDCHACGVPLREGAIQASTASRSHLPGSGPQLRHCSSVRSGLTLGLLQ